MSGFAPHDRDEIAKRADAEQAERPYLTRASAVLAAYFAAPRTTCGKPSAAGLVAQPPAVSFEEN